MLVTDGCAADASLTYASTGGYEAVALSSAFPGREAYALTVLSDDTLVLAGGNVAGVGFAADVWRSNAEGTGWVRQTNNGLWTPRQYFALVALPDDRLVLLGGRASAEEGDVWRSTNLGVQWSRLHTLAEFGARQRHQAVALDDGSVIVMGGVSGSTLLNDVWKSVDAGATWTEVTSAAPWEARNYFSAASVGGSIVVAGGFGTSMLADVWRSEDGGETWTEETSTAEWGARYKLLLVALPRGPLLVLGGYAAGDKKDMWRSDDGGATWREQAVPPWDAARDGAAVAQSTSQVLVVGGRKWPQAGPEQPHSEVWRVLWSGWQWEEEACSAAHPGICSAIPRSVPVSVTFNGGSTTLTPPVAAPSAATSVVYVPPQPAISLSPGQAAITATNTLSFSVSFPAIVVNLAANHFNVIADGVATSRTLTGSGTAWTLEVTLGQGAVSPAAPLVPTPVDIELSWEEHNARCHLVSTLTADELAVVAAARSSTSQDYW